MEFVILPLAMLDSPEYRGLNANFRTLLVDLYAKHGDCKRFTIEVGAHIEYGYANYTNLLKALRTLIAAGLILIDGGIKGKRGPPRKIFTFKYPTIDV
jgi:hypothetical protein